MSVQSALRGIAQPSGPGLPVGIGSFHQLFTGIEVPDPVTFVYGPTWLNRGHLYPRQATLVKIVFLREDLFTDYDYAVVEEWEAAFVDSNGLEGLAPGLLDKMRLLKSLGHKWFREVLLILGRRGGKGHVAALCMAYVLWNYMAKGDPQGFYGVDRDKQLIALMFAGKRDQAKANLYGDLVNVITGSECFLPYINADHTEKLTIFAPNDFVRMRRQAVRGVRSERDSATFAIVPRESTMMAGRGPTSFCLDPMTPVLTADLRWTPIGDLLHGDVLVGIDEYPERPGAHRKMRRSTVEKVWRTTQRALRITFVDGSAVVCSPEHRWLVRDMGKGGSTHWRMAGGMRSGNHIKHCVEPWSDEQTWSRGYLAGVYDGEGCISGWSGRAGKSVFFSQNDGPVLDQTLSLLKDEGLAPVRYSHLERRCQQWELAGAEAVRFLGMVRPTRLMAKAGEVWDGVAPRGGTTPSGRARADSYKTIVSIEELPERELVDLTTSTRTFIANGLVSHNCQAYDEMAHVVSSGANRSASEVYGAAKPSLDQFGKDAFIVEPSSPWQMLGQFYDNWNLANEKEPDGSFAYPDMLSLQLASWDIYLDWEQAPDLPLLPEGFDGDLHEYAHQPLPRFTRFRGAIQVYDEQMAREERANPETFKVERRAKWASVLDAYLNEAKVRDIFSPWAERPERYGPPDLAFTTQGVLTVTYKGHADPSKVNDKFGFALAHAEYDAEQRPHCVFDQIGAFDPADFPDGIIDYEEVDDWVWDHLIQPFMPGEFTYDQYNSTSSIQRMQKRLRAVRLPKRVQVFEKTTTKAYDWQVKENAKAAINLNLVHAPYLEQAELELRFLQLVNGKVDHPASGPVQTKDIADCMTECIHVLIGEQVNNFLHAELNSFRSGAAMEGGIEPFREMFPDHESDDRIAALSSFGRPRGRQEFTPSRNQRHRPRRPY